jgi:hypothetical protein
MAAYTRCLRCAGAPRRPASGSELSLRVLSWHAVPCDPGESDHRQFQISDVGVAFAVSRAARHSQKPAIRFTREVIFEATWFTQSLRPTRLLAPLYGSDRHSSRPTGAFTSRLSTGRSPSLLLDITTTASGLLCWRGFHPQERQLASLHLLDHLATAPAARCRNRRRPMCFTACSPDGTKVIPIAVPLIGP